MWFDSFTVESNCLETWFSLNSRFPPGAVGSILPNVFEAYVRIMHPVQGFRESDPDFRWDEIARQEGAIAHSAMQWHKITRNATLYGPWRNRAKPLRGRLRRDYYRQLLGILGETAWTDDVTIGYWEGYQDFRDDVPEPFCDPRLRISLTRIGRLDYLVFCGPFRDLLRGADAETQEGEWPETPNITCSADRGWCVFSEIDFDSTLVGCSKATARAISADKLLESYEVFPETDLSALGDALNR